MSDAANAHRFPVNHAYTRVDAYVAEYVSELGRESLRVRTLRPLPEGSRVQFQYAVLLDEFRFVAGTGVVVHSNNTEASAGMVIRYTTITDTTHHVLEMVERAARPS